MFARPLIDGIDFASNGRELHGEIPIKSLSRLSDTLAHSQGAIAYTVVGSRVNEQYTLEVALSGVCHLVCQRCLGELVYPVDVTSHLLMVPADKLDEYEANDDVECIEATSQMDVLELIEDELLLFLPFAPKHPDGACIPVSQGSKQSTNPFSILADLKKKY